MIDKKNETYVKLVTARRHLTLLQRIQISLPKATYSKRANGKKTKQKNNQTSKANLYQKFYLETMMEVQALETKFADLLKNYKLKGGSIKAVLDASRT